MSGCHEVNLPALLDALRRTDAALAPSDDRGSRGGGFRMTADEADRALKAEHELCDDEIRALRNAP